MDIRTKTRTELIDITERIRAVVKDSGIKDGICVITTPHTTCGIIINENERGLRADILELLETHGRAYFLQSLMGQETAR